MIDDLFQAMFTNHIVFYTVWSWLPFKMIETVKVIISRLPTREYNNIRIIFIIARFNSTTLLKDPHDEFGIIAWSNYVFQWFFLILFVSIFWNIWILYQSIFSCLYESLLFLSRWFKWVGQPLWWEISRLLNFLNDGLFGLLTFSLAITFNFFTINTYLLGSTFRRVGCYNCLIFLLWISYLFIHFQFVEVRFCVGSRLFTWLAFLTGFYAIFIIAYCV